MVSRNASAHALPDAYARAHEPPRSGSGRRVLAGAHLSRVVDLLGSESVGWDLSRSVTMAPIPRTGKRRIGKGSVLVPLGPGQSGE
jgi:hypothetical protein